MLKGTKPRVLCNSHYGNGAFAPFANGILLLSLLSEAVRARQPVGEGTEKLNLVFSFLAVPTRCVHDL